MTAPDPSLRAHSPDVIAAKRFIPIGDHQQSQAKDGVDGRWHDRQQQTSKHVMQQNVPGQPVTQQNVLGQSAIHAQPNRRRRRPYRW